MRRLKAPDIVALAARYAEVLPLPPTKVPKDFDELSLAFLWGYIMGRDAEYKRIRFPGELPFHWNKEAAIETYEENFCVKPKL